MSEMEDIADTELDELHVDWGDLDLVKSRTDS